MAKCGHCGEDQKDMIDSSVTITENAVKSEYTCLSCYFSWEVMIPVKKDKRKQKELDKYASTLIES